MSGLQRSYQAYDYIRMKSLHAAMEASSAYIAAIVLYSLNEKLKYH